MKLSTLRAAMQETYVSDAKLTEYLPHFEAAMRAANITTVRRAAAWCAQIGHESAGLRYMAEIETSNPAWSADRTRYRGRGPIQLTWSSNYRAFGRWCVDRDYITDPETFVVKPELVEHPRWGFLAASWYWLNAGPFAGRLNEFADRGDILNVSRGVNGNVPTPHGMPDRTARWNRCLALGEVLLPTKENTTMSAADDELTKRFASRSKYRGSDAKIDTLAGFILNVDARIHEEYVEREALKGTDWCVELVKREAAKGDAGAQAVLDKIKAGK